ncbi:MAG: tyrosine-type recombinase/integrase, partial [Halanaerobiales bacterium]
MDDLIEKSDLREEIVENRLEDRTDDKVIIMWLKEKSDNTQDAYSTDINQFLNYINDKSLKKVILEDVQDYKDYLIDSYGSKATISRKLSAVKSLFSFAHRIGYLMYNVATPMVIPSVRQRLNEKILSEEEIVKMLSVVRKRDYALIRLLYSTAARISEVTNLQWRDIRKLEDGSGVISIWGKNDKERHVRISKDTFKVLLSLKETNATENSYIFRSQKGN